MLNWLTYCHSDNSQWTEERSSGTNLYSCEFGVTDKNTIKFLSLQGTRTRKLEARKLREQKEEEEKQAIDLEEAKYQAQKRKEAIEKAKTQQYYQTDRVKNFHVSQSLSM